MIVVFQDTGKLTSIESFRSFQTEELSKLWDEKMLEKTSQSQ
jgi:hypothetical protein